ncbi:MAG TPA: hypothetical protein VK307_12500 [Thermoleophilaceae bacterium]|nr:hypothetical protein [Thermoleophilaceae bacterium]
MTELETAIHAQPAELRRLAELSLPLRVRELGDAERVWLVGTGTSLHAAELGAMMLQRAGLDARFSSSMDFALRAPLRTGDAVVVLTHTGSTAHARASRQRALDAGARLLSVTATEVGWPEAIEATERERSHTYTRSYTAVLAILALIADELGADGLGPRAILATADALERVLANPGAGTLPEPPRLLVLCGSGPGSVTAREGALKLREAARLTAEGYDAEFLLHGSAVPLGAHDALVVLDGARDSEGFLPRLAAAARAEGVPVMELEQPEPEDALMAQIALVAHCQLAALRRAEAGGHDPDRVIVGAWHSDELWETGAPTSGA